MKINKDNIYWKVLEEREILDAHPILKNDPIYWIGHPIPGYRKQPSSHKPYNFLKTIAFRLGIPFESCYSDIFYLIRLKNINRMIKSSF